MRAMSRPLAGGMVLRDGPHSGLVGQEPKQQPGNTAMNGLQTPKLWVIGAEIMAKVARQLHRMCYENRLTRGFTTHSNGFYTSQQARMAQPCQYRAALPSKADACRERLLLEPWSP
jgi:hypothetical protein